MKKRLSPTHLEILITTTKKDIPLGSQWHHYKSTTAVYTVQDIAFDVHSTQAIVIYTADYVGDAVLFTRQADNFLSHVEDI